MGKKKFLKVPGQQSQMPVTAMSKPIVEQDQILETAGSMTYHAKQHKQHLGSWANLDVITETEKNRSALANREKAGFSMSDSDEDEEDFAKTRVATTKVGKRILGAKFMAKNKDNSSMSKDSHNLNSAKDEIELHSDFANSKIQNQFPDVKRRKIISSTNDVKNKQKQKCDQWVTNPQDELRLPQIDDEDSHDH